MTLVGSGLQIGHIGYQQQLPFGYIGVVQRQSFPRSAFHPNATDAAIEAAAGG